MRKKALDFIRFKGQKIRKSLVWHKSYFTLRHRIKCIQIMHTISVALKVIVVIASYIAILLYVKLIISFKSGFLEFNTAYSTEYIDKSGVLGIQITLTLVCVSLIALISNIEKKVIYGESLMDLAFPSRLLSFKLMMNVQFGLLLVNCYLMLVEAAFVYIIWNFLTTIYIMAIVLYRFASVFLNQHSYKDRLYCKYYKCNMTYLNNQNLTDSLRVGPMRKLRVMTLRSISQKDYLTLNDNLLLYFELLNVTLFNHPQLVIEYYTEYRDYQDLIGSIKDFSLELLYNQASIDGLQVYNALLNRLNYYNVVCVNELAYTSTYFIDAFPDISDRLHIKNYCTALLHMSKLLIHQAYLYTAIDFSDCRLNKLGLISHYYGGADTYEKIYNSIVQSNKLSDSEKEDLIEDIRSNIIELVVNEYYFNVDDFLNKRSLHKENQYSLDIKGEPIALLFIRFLENCDYNSLNKCHSLSGIRNNREDYSSMFALVLAMLSALNSLYLKGEREYSFDIQIDRDTAKTVFKKCRLLNTLNTVINENVLDELYDFIIPRYIRKADNDDAAGGIYGFNPKFNYRKEVVDTFFGYYYQKRKQNKCVEEMCIQKGLLYAIEVEEILLELEA